MSEGSIYLCGESDEQKKVMPRHFKNFFKKKALIIILILLGLMLFFVRFKL
ncbi:hypothetical protein HY643_01685 [Candidatus Woesearchaeota archaeon]|nr:hypothetical protein [Candidatus Woesearchaeota archaeon]